MEIEIPAFSSFIFTDNAVIKISKSAFLSTNFMSPFSRNLDFKVLFIIFLLSILSHDVSIFSFMFCP